MSNSAIAIEPPLPVRPVAIASAAICHWLHRGMGRGPGRILTDSAPAGGPPAWHTSSVVAAPLITPDLRARLGSGDFLLGTWLTILDPVVPELLAGSGFDLLVADGEHGP